MLELALVDYRASQHEPSRLAAAAVLLGNELLGHNPAWSTALSVLSRHARSSLKACVEDLRSLLEMAPKSSLQAVRKKYSDQKRLSVAKLNLSPFHTLNVLV